MVVDAPSVVVASLAAKVHLPGATVSEQGKKKIMEVNHSASLALVTGQCNQMRNYLLS